MKLLLAALAATVTLVPANATWKPEYAQLPQEVRDWYRNAELTEAAKRRLPWTKCCDHADVVKTQFKVDRSTGEDVWLWLDPQTQEWRQVPPDIVHEDTFAPGEKPILFVYQGIPTCFFKPGGGI